MAYKILQITIKPPFPEIDGGCLEIAKMSKNYDSREEYKLDIFSFSTYKHPFIKNEFEKSLTKEVKVTSGEIKTKPTILGALLSIISGKSYNLNRFVNKKIINDLTQIVKNNEYDFIHCESIYTAQYVTYLKPITNAKFILNAPNAEHKLWKQYSNNSSFFKKIYLNHLSKRIQKQEISIWNNMDGIICITEELNYIIKNNTDKTPTLVLPFKLNLKDYVITKNNNKVSSLFHIGAMDWEPNKEGMKWFLESVWDSISETSTLHLAGKGIAKENYTGYKSIEVHGFVNDAKEFINSHDIMIVPLLSGSGMRIKIIEAMALGKCIVSTTKGAEGIQYTDKKNIWIADSANEFILALNKLKNDPQLVMQLGAEARLLVENKYDIKDLNETLYPFLKTLK